MRVAAPTDVTPDLVDHQAPVVDTPPAAPRGAPDGGAVPASVAVVGAGASGILTAIHLLASRSHELRVTLHEARPRLGDGLAYGTTDARHLLNVRSRHMSAFPDIPGHLVEWAAAAGREHDAQAFLPRRDYADYLRETLASMADHRLQVSAGRVHDVVARPGGGWTLLSDDDAAPVTEASAVVLAPGNAAPAPLAVGGRAVPAAPWHLGDPWDLEALRALPDDAVVVLVGTGLTAVDAATTLLGDAPGRRVVMVSRHGLLPEAHVAQSSTAWVSPVPGEGPVTADQLAALVQDQIAAAERQGVDWRPVVDGLRAPTQGLWQRLDLDERRRFLSTWARRWEVLRHRMAPEVAAGLQGWQAEGRLEVRAGGLGGLTDLGARVDVELPGATTGPGARGPEVVRADAVVNCTGPMTDVSRTRDPLLRSLVDRGVVGPDPLRLGFACTPAGEVLDESGREVPGLYVVGPPRKGVLWESTAVPEIRAQAQALAALLPQRVRSAG